MFIDHWLEIIRSADTASTYKMAWAKAITHVAYEMNYDGIKPNDLIDIGLDLIAVKFFSYYWDQDVFFRLHQNSNTKKLAAIVHQVRDIEEKVSQLKGSNAPIKFIKAEGLIRALGTPYVKKEISKTVKILKQDVSHRFLSPKQSDSPYAPAYALDLDKEIITMKAEYLMELKDNLNLVLDVINFKWVLVLEQYNMSPRIGRKVRHMDSEQDGRKPLHRFHRHLVLENPEQVCFICGKIIEGGNASVDHVIPWSFMYSDDIWNLVLVHKSCNSRKGNTIPTEAEIDLLKERNKRLLEKMKLDPNFANNKLCFELEDSLVHDLARRFWVQCLG